MIAAFVVVRALRSYSERQLRLLLAWMPMKVGKKTVETATVAISARYIAWFSDGAADTAAALEQAFLHKSERLS